MSGPHPSEWELLGSLVTEERRGRPGAAVQAAFDASRQDVEHAAAHLLVAVYGELAAGEPREAFRLLDRIGETPDRAIRRRVRACRAWAQQLDWNWYPGNVGGELAPLAREGLIVVGEVLEADPETMLVEACAAHGPGFLLTARATLEWMTRGAPQEATQVLQPALDALGRFQEIAIAQGQAASACWAVLAQSDLLHRSGRVGQAEQALAHVRQIYQAGNDAVGLAGTYLVEGDWWATPGSSPEALGLDLAVHTQRSPLAERRDDARASEAYRKAASLLESVDAPRVSGALAVRRAVIAWRAGAYSVQIDWLAEAEQAFAEAGDRAGSHLVSIHRWVAWISQENRSALRGVLPSEWGAGRGPVIEIGAWGSERGSVSYCTGLGRILHRVANQWLEKGDLDRAETAYLMARPLLSLSGAVPPWTLPADLSHLDQRRGMTARSLARRLHALSLVPPAENCRDSSVAWLQQVEFLLPFITIPSGTIGQGPIAVRLITQASDRLEALLRLAESPSISGAASPPQSTAAAPVVSDKPPAQAVNVVRELLARKEPLVSHLRAGELDRGGWEADAERWYQEALRASRSAGPEIAWLEVLVLAALGRHEEARAVLARIREGGQMEEGLLPTVALRARDFATARDFFRKVDAEAPAQSLDWLQLLERALAAVECGEPEEAFNLGSRAIDAFEKLIHSLARDADRIAACDNLNAASLYQTVARACLALSEECRKKGDEPGHFEWLGRSFSVADRLRSFVLPPRLDTPVGGEAQLVDRLREWGKAAAEHSTAYHRLLAALALDGNERRPHLAEQLARADERMADLESDLSVGERERIHGTQRSAPFTVANAQAHLPEGCCLLEYQLVGRDLVAWGVTRKTILGWHERLPGRALEGTIHRLLRSCAAGEPSREAGELAKILLEPFRGLLKEHQRVLVVPFGSLHTVPFHVLPFFGAEPLGATHVISYLPAASLLRENSVDQPITSREALVVGDPAFDPVMYPTLRRLAGAALEADVVRRIYGTERFFPGAKAREGALRPLLSGARILHIAAHGRLDETAPNASSIVLAGQDQLCVSDLIGLQATADLAVLSACDTGRGVSTLGGDLVGLTRGLLAAGVRRSVVSLWPVDDLTACVTMVRFHQMLIEQVPPAAALAGAQREVRGLSGAQLVARYRELGGEHDPSRPAARRGALRGSGTLERGQRLALFPEVDLGEEIPPGGNDPLSGHLARIWAPFVLVGC